MRHNGAELRRGPLQLRNAIREGCVAIPEGCNADPGFRVAPREGCVAIREGRIKTREGRDAIPEGNDATREGGIRDREGRDAIRFPAPRPGGSCVGSPAAGSRSWDAAGRGGAECKRVSRKPVATPSARA